MHSLSPTLRALSLVVLLLCGSGCESDVEPQVPNQWTVVGNPGNTLFAISAGQGVVLSSAELHLAGADSLACDEGSSALALAGVPETVDLLSDTILAGLIPGSLLDASSDSAANESGASSSYCSLVLRPADREGGNLVLAGEWGNGDGPQPFTAQLSLSDLTFPLDEELVVDGQQFIWELAPEGWLTAEVLANSLEPGELIEPGHSLHPVLLGQVVLGAAFYEDSDRDGLLTLEERTNNKLGNPPAEIPLQRAVALGRDTASNIGAGFYSENGGETWSEATSFVTGAETHPRAVAWGAGRFVAVGPRLFMNSLDGIEWGSFGAPEVELEGVTFGADRWVAVGQGGARLWSTDGVTWEDASSDGDELWKSVVWDEAFGFVAVGKFGKWACSPDGTTWTAGVDLEFESGTPQHLYSVTALDGQLVAVGDEGARLVHDGPDCSEDWTDVRLESELAYTAIAAGAEGDEAYMAVGLELASFSQDGTNWTDAAPSTDIRAVTSAGSDWIIATGDGWIATFTTGPSSGPGDEFEAPGVEFSCITTLP